MTATELALANLRDNEAIDWLFGRVLHKLAARGQHHFLFELLSGSNPRVLEWWNSWLSEFRSALKNPDVAARKADDDFSNSPPERIGDFIAEIVAVIHLSRDGYTDFEVVLVGTGPSAAVVDYIWECVHSLILSWEMNIGSRVSVFCEAYCDKR